LILTVSYLMDINIFSRERYGSDGLPKSHE
jgi:hypothetical protein